MDDAAMLTELRALRAEQERTRLMLARTMVLLLSLARPLTAAQEAALTRRLLALDGAA